LCLFVTYDFAYFFVIVGFLSYFVTDLCKTGFSHLLLFVYTINETVAGNI